MTDVDDLVPTDDPFLTVDGFLVALLRPGDTLVTQIIEPLSGITLDNRAKNMDIKAERGDDQVIPMTFMDDARQVRDGVTAFGVTTIISPSAPWTSGDVGSAITGDKIPFGTTIASFSDASTIVISQAATGTAIDARFQWGPASDQSQATFSAQVRANPGSEKVEADFVVDASLAANGLVTFTLPTGAMASLRAGRHYWDLQRVLSNIRKTFFKGAFIVEGDVTRP